MDIDADNSDDLPATRGKRRRAGDLNLVRATKKEVAKEIRLRQWKAAPLFSRRR